MVVEITAPKLTDHDLEHLVSRVFFKAIDLLGGLHKLAEYRALTWLPALARASFVIVLREEYLKTEEEIAKILGIAKSTVRNILRADPQLALYKIQHIDELTKEEKKQLKVHTAGGIAKLAYKFVKEGEEAQVLLEYCRELSAKAVQACDAPWAYIVLKNIKGLKYPVTSPEPLKEKLAGLTIKGIPAEEVVENISYPIKNPAQLLHEIKEYLEMKGV
ncbi:MAG: bacterio-opsin activator [Aquificae bacterium]|nr:bacterio-opsin activator [Aquificota bacterium]